ncbi:MAG TPA: fatty acid--CoA ligase family protein, partial [Deferrisomatales bacterium]|nr:fatty acid--CoA ligase family protein [Deferrisomatales bacterium]
EPAVGPDDLCMLLYTSGTTGQPKGAMIGQSQTVRAGMSYALVVDAQEDDVFLAFLSMGHSYGCGALLVQPVVLGATAVIMETFRPKEAFRLIQEERVTLQPGAPAHYLMELSSPDRQNYDLSSLRAGMIAGQIAPAGLIRRVEEEMGVYISSFLGSSEVGPGNSILLPYGSSLEDRESSIGKPIPGTQIKIIDPVSGVELPDGETGELLLSGWHVMRGYWHKPEETQRQVKDGWMHTGDLAARDERGNVRILGRLKEWINRGGFKILPSELEALLVHHPDVAEACVVNTPNPVLGESICACLKLKDGTKTLALNDVREYLADKVAKFKLPDELVIFEEFPRMPGGLKVNRFGGGGVIDLAKIDPKKQTLHPA